MDGPEEDNTAVPIAEMEVDLLLKSGIEKELLGKREDIIHTRPNRDLNGNVRVKTRNRQLQDAPEIVVPIAGFIANRSKCGIDLRGGRARNKLRKDLIKALLMGSYWMRPNPGGHKPSI